MHFKYCWFDSWSKSVPVTYTACQVLIGLNIPDITTHRKYQMYFICHFRWMWYQVLTHSRKNTLYWLLSTGVPGVSFLSHTYQIYQNSILFINLLLIISFWFWSGNHFVYRLSSYNLFSCDHKRIIPVYVLFRSLQPHPHCRFYMLIYKYCCVSL